MPRRCLTPIVLAASLAPGACALSPVCDEPGAVCLDTEDITQVRVGFVADALAVVDVDGDGELDLVAASGPAGTLSIVWSDDWFKGAATTWSIDQEVAGLVVADLDGDGRLDLATALPRADAVAVVRGRGGRSFAAPERFAAGAVPRALVAADLDGTGPPELVTGNLGDGTVTVLRGFVADPPIVVGPGPRALAAGDLDGDGHGDVAVALADADAVQILRGDGRGGLWPAALHAVGAAPVAVVAGDLDGDGGLDLATADSLDDTVSLLWSDGAGGHQARRAWPTAALPSALVVVPQNDGDAVLGVLSESTSSIEHLGPRSGLAISGVLPGRPQALAAWDGFLLAAGRAVNRLPFGLGLILTELWQRPGGSWVWPVDVEGDGIDELLLADPFGEPGVMTLRGDIESTIAVPVGLEFPDLVRGGDVSGDGRADVLLRSAGKLAVLVQQPDGTLEAGEVHELSDVRGTEPVDLGGDGIAEVLVLTRSDHDSTLKILRSDGAGVLSEVDTRVIEQRADGLRVIDGDGDAAPDLLLNLHGGEDYLYLEDLYGPSRTLSGCLDLVADIDDDGRLDAVCCRHELFVAYDVFTMGNEAPIETIDSRCHEVRALDLDRDGDLELLTLDYDTEFGDDVLRFTPWVRESGSWDARASRSFASPGYSVAHTYAELDGGGTPELLFFDKERIVAASVELALTFVPHEFTRLSDRPEVRFGDVDGDGAADLLTFGSTLAVARADGEGGFGALSHFWDPRGSSGGHMITDAQIISVEREGGARVVWSSHLDGSARGGLTLADVDLDGVHERMHLEDADTKWAHMFPVELDGDGLRDLVVLGPAYFSGASRLSGMLLRGRDDGSLEAPEILMFDNDYSVDKVGVHDIDRDGHLDLVAHAYVVSLDNPRYGVFVFPGRGDGTFGSGEQWNSLASRVFDPRSAPLLFGDFDRDGNIELVTDNGYGELLWVRGGAQAGARVLFRDVGAFTAADLDRDGHLELLVAQPAYSGGATTLHVSRHRLEGGLGFSEHIVHTTGVREIHVADIDGDGELDIALADDLGATIVRRMR